MDNGYYPETRYHVLTANPDLSPLAVYEIDRGQFATITDAKVLADELAEMGEPSQIERREWREVRHHAVWTPAKRPAPVKGS
jgi:hypothetical protein